MSEQINGHTFHYDVADDVVASGSLSGADLKRYAEQFRNFQAQAQSDAQQFTGQFTSGYVAPAAPCPTCHRCPTCGHYGYAATQPYYPSITPAWESTTPPDKYTVFNGLPGIGGLGNWQQTAAGNTDNSKLSGCS